MSATGKYFSAARSGDVATERSEYVQINATGGVGNATIEFNIPASAAGMIDLSSSYIRSTVRVNLDATNTGSPRQWYLGGDDQVAVEEGFGDAMWSNVQTYINGVDVSDSTPGLYPHAAFARHAITKDAAWRAPGGLIRYTTPNTDINTDAGAGAVGDLIARVASTATAGWGAKFSGYSLSSHANSNGQADTNGGKHETANSTFASANAGLADRHIAIAFPGNSETTPSELTDFLTVPQEGIWRQSTLLPSNVDLRVVLTKSSNAFMLHDSGQASADSTASINWTVAGAGNKCVLFLKRVYPTAVMRAALDAHYLHAPMAYNLMQSRAARYEVGTATSVSATNLLTGVRPDVVLVSFVHKAALAGDYNVSPFATIETEAYDGTNPTLSGHESGDFVNSIYVNWGGRQFPQQPITASNISDNGEAYAAYMAVAKQGMFGSSTPFLLPDDFKSDRRIFAFRLRPDDAPAGSKALMGPDGEDLSDRGSLSVHATLTRGGSPIDCTMVVIGFSAASVEIDASRQIRKIGF